jgi:hypothetical protein
MTVIDTVPLITTLTEEDLPNWGGYQQAADWIGVTRSIVVTRQRVYSLALWRHGNGFPQSYIVRLPSGIIKQHWFYRPQIEEWARTHHFRNSRLDP